MKKTLGFTIICKNELHNLPRLFKSLNGLADDIYISDTGSSDGTVEYLRSEQAMVDAGCKIHLFFYQWNDDFAAARNHNLCMIKNDYWAWIDCDDVVCQTRQQREFFLAWKKSAMSVADAWFIPYQYAFNEKGESMCSFIRERVFKTSLGAQFQDFIHEGVKLKEGTNAQAVNTWTVDHLRTPDEAQADKGRNLRILLNNRDKLTSRLTFYLGKEYFDAGDFESAANTLREVVKKADLNPGDRVLAFQYLVHSLIATKKYQDALEYNILAVNLDPLRAEFHCFMGDIYISIGEPNKAVPFYQAAKACSNRGNGMSHEFSFSECYDVYPRTNLAKIYYNMGQFERCIHECDGLPGENPKEILKEAKLALFNLSPPRNAIECDDIIITCPAQGAYPWNEKLYSEKGLGGSETAAVEMALWLKEITKRQVRIFNNSSELFIGRTGVEYRPAAEVYDYFRKWKPKLHIAWRHSARLTQSPSYIWCHDLVTPGADNIGAYDKIMALSDFHVEFLMANLGIPREKIMRTRNGISPALIRETKALGIKKQKGKVLWPNSLDRGLEHAIRIMDKVKAKVPEAELHVFYGGLENFENYGLKEKGEELKKMIEARPWVKYVGNVTKERLMQEFASAEVWLYPASFIETFCLSALESVLMSCWPVIREFGALNSTMKDFKDRDLCDMHDIDCDKYDKWAEIVIDAIEEKKWEKIEIAKVNPDDYSWESVAKSWIKEFNL